MIKFFKNLNNNINIILEKIELIILSIAKINQYEEISRTFKRTDDIFKFDRNKSLNSNYKYYIKKFNSNNIRSKNLENVINRTSYLIYRYNEYTNNFNINFNIISQIKFEFNTLCVLYDKLMNDIFDDMDNVEVIFESDTISDNKNSISGDILMYTFYSNKMCKLKIIKSDENLDIFINTNFSQLETTIKSLVSKDIILIDTE